MDNAERDSRTTAAGLARYAREFFEAALAVDDRMGRRPGYERIPPTPVLFLVAHSIELALKAYLRHSGMSVSAITDLRHDLMRCWNVACRHGIETHVSLDDVDLEVIGVLNDLHVSTELRYIVTGAKTFPAFGPLQGAAQKLLNAICPLVGYR
jgi:hypothetical protein